MKYNYILMLLEKVMASEEYLNYISRDFYNKLPLFWALTLHLFSF